MKYFRAILILLSLLLATGCGARQDAARVYRTPEMKGELTITVFAPSRFLETAAALFMDKYPDVTITINNFVDQLKTVTNAENGTVMSAVTEEYSLENYLLYMNTRIMSGQADDLFDMRMLTTYRYEDMGVFEDLSFYIENAPEINGENFYMNIFDAMRDKGGRMFELPVFGAADTFVYFDTRLAENTGLFLDESLQTISYRDAIAYAQKLCRASTLEETYLSWDDAAKAAMRYVNDSYATYIDLYNYEVHFDSEAFIGLLHEVQALYAEFGEGYSPTGKIAYNYESADWQAAIYAILSPASQSQTMPLADENGAVPYNCQSYAINSKSPDKDLAWEFLRFMLTDEVQTLPSLALCGVSKVGLHAYAESVCSNARAGGGVDVPEEAFRQMLNNWLLLVNAHHRRDYRIEEKLYAELIRFFSGSQTAEETAKTLQSWCNMYLNQ